MLNCKSCGKYCKTTFCHDCELVMAANTSIYNNSYNTGTKYKTEVEPTTLSKKEESINDRNILADKLQISTNFIKDVYAHIKTHQCLCEKIITSNYLTGMSTVIHKCLKCKLSNLYTKEGLINELDQI